MSRKSIIITVVLLAGLGALYLLSDAPLPVDVTVAEKGEVKGQDQPAPRLPHRHAFKRPRLTHHRRRE